MEAKCEISDRSQAICDLGVWCISIQKNNLEASFLLLTSSHSCGQLLTPLTILLVLCLTTLEAVQVPDAVIVDTIVTCSYYPKHGT